MDKKVFVTVGTTKFDLLIKKIISDDILNWFVSHGFKKLVLQIGNGHFVPDIKITGLSVEYYRFKECLAYDIITSSLVISHAGAGTCIEVLEANKPLIVVINENLMDNHQLELAQQLQQDKLVLFCTCSDLSSIVQNLDFNVLKTYPKSNAKTFLKYIDNCMGFN